MSGMQKVSMSCPSCGAPLSDEVGKTRIACHYCGMVTLLQSDNIPPVPNKLSSALSDAVSGSIRETKELKLNQELSLLQMNLSELREQKNRIEQEYSIDRQTKLNGIALEEITVNNRIAAIQDQLGAIATKPPAIPLPIVSQEFISNKSWGTTLFLACTLGGWGVHRFYSGNIPIGVLQLFTFGGFGVWVLFDIIMILTDNFKDGQGRPLNKSIKANPLMMKLIGGFMIWFLIFGFSMPQDGAQPSSGFMSFLIFGVPLLLLILFNVKTIIGWFKKKKI